MQNKPTRAILFDFDGVIVDTFEMCFEIKKKSFPLFSKEEYRSHFDGNIYDAIKKYAPNFTQAEHDDYFNQYAPKLMEILHVPGLESILCELSKNFILIVISSTNNESIHTYLARYKLSSYFTEVMGSDDETNKSKKIQIVFKKYNLMPKECLFVTDTLGDIREAAAVNVSAIGVTWGFHPTETLQKGNPYAMVSTPAELLNTIKNYFAEYDSV